MKDRTPEYPGRVRLTPVAGQENIYDMTMADEPIEPGTPPTKANLLTDSTAAAIGNLSGTVPGTVNEALNQLTLGVHGRLTIDVQSYVGTGTSGETNGVISLTFPFAPVLLMIFPGDLYGAMRHDLTSYYNYGNHYGESIAFPATLTTAYQGNSSTDALWGGLLGSYSASAGTHEGWVRAKKSADGKTISWYGAYSDSYATGLAAEVARNVSGTTYYVLAIGATT